MSFPVDPFPHFQVVSKLPWGKKKKRNENLHTGSISVLVSFTCWWWVYHTVTYPLEKAKVTLWQVFSPFVATAHQGYSKYSTQNSGERTHIFSKRIEFLLNIHLHNRSQEAGRKQGKRPHEAWSWNIFYTPSLRPRMPPGSPPQLNLESLML